MMTFEELNLTKPLIRALGELGYTTPTTIQQNVFSTVMSGRDVCGLAQTGTGKTLAYLLPSLRQLQFSTEKLPQLLIIVPTRELVVQILETVNQLTAHMNLVAVGVYGGVNLKPQVAQVQQGMDVLVATPGRLVDLLSSGGLKTKAIKKVVIDEVDEMLNLGFRTQLKIILDSLPQKRQNLLFSATLTPDVEQLIETFFTNPVRVEAAPVGTPLENIAQTAYNVPNFYTKINLLERLLSQDATMTKVLIFVATKSLADQVQKQLEPEFPGQVGVIHSNKAQNQRFEAVELFKAGTYQILVATDLVSRGIDIRGVSHVLNFDMPDLPENYIHRIGRTGRADQSGVAISFITEADREKQVAIEALMNYTIPMLPLPLGLAISAVLTEDEKPTVYIKTIGVKVPKREEVGPAFHEKLDKNKKVNVRRDHAAEKMRKYGRPIKRSGKK